MGLESNKKETYFQIISKKKYISAPEIDGG